MRGEKAIKRGGSRERSEEKKKIESQQYPGYEGI